MIKAVVGASISSSQVRQGARRMTPMWRPEVGGIIRILERLVFPRRMSEDNRLLVAFAFSLGFDTVLAGLWLNVSGFARKACLSVDLQDAPPHI